MNFLCSWSGGKDSCYAFYKAVQLGYNPMILLNVMNEYGDCSRSHGISREVLLAQSEAIEVPIHFFNSTWEHYEENYVKHLKDLTKHHAITHTVFGDIDIDSHRAWEEKVSNAAGVEAILPLWQQNRKLLVLEMIANGIEAMIVSCNQQLGPEFLGRTINASLLEEFESIGIDACGENGEYHTLVVNAPFFKHKLNVEVKEKVISSNYNFAELKLN
ncbi:diphthine--ammonia ligase [Flavobacteriaceae bacterium AU392]|nr:diphthine--ammonia ligase [Flavobacteriaceae bacterium]RKM83531.1 diphthine--ammonia ligase [Flavobacteriaceae bacterium AU392]